MIIVGGHFFLNLNIYSLNSLSNTDIVSEKNEIFNLILSTGFNDDLKLNLSLTEIDNIDRYDYELYLYKLKKLKFQKEEENKNQNESLNGSNSF